jgi:hypothetical protein
MAKFFVDLLQFMDALIDHWVAFVTGSVPALLLGIWEHWKGRSLSWRTYVAVFLVFGFVAASFQTWRAERVEGAHARNPAIVQQLQKFYVEAEEYRRTIEQATGPARETVQREADEWAEGVGHWIIDNMGMAAYVRLIKLPEGQSKYGTDESHRTQAMLALIRDNLEKLIENGAWDKS